MVHRSSTCISVGTTSIQVLPGLKLTAPLFAASLRRGRWVAWLFWMLIVAMAWLGINQPS